MWIRCSIQPALDADLARSTVPEQCCVPVFRTEVVWTATVAAVLDWLVTRAELKTIFRSPACPAAKDEYPPS